MCLKSKHEAKAILEIISKVLSSDSLKNDLRKFDSEPQFARGDTYSEKLNTFCWAYSSLGTEVLEITTDCAENVMWCALFRKSECFCRDYRNQYLASFEFDSCFVGTSRDTAGLKPYSY